MLETMDHLAVGHRESGECQRSVACVVTSGRGGEAGNGFVIGLALIAVVEQDCTVVSRSAVVWLRLQRLLIVGKGTFTVVGAARKIMANLGRVTSDERAKGGEDVLWGE
jgi:hypothetical protein